VISEAGLERLAELDEPIEAAVRATLEHVSRERLQVLLELLEEVRGV
jgi:hypothetical protein